MKIKLKKKSYIYKHHTLVEDKDNFITLYNYSDCYFDKGICW